MIVRTLDEVTGTKGEAHGPKWHSMRLLQAEDGMGLALTDSILEEGFEMTIGRNNRLEACYCLEGGATIKELETGRVHMIRPGTLYAMNNHDRHRIRITERTRLVCTFVPALTGLDQPDADGPL